MTATTSTAKPAPIKTNRPMPRPPVNVIKAPPSPVSQPDPVAADADADAYALDVMSATANYDDVDPAEQISLLKAKASNLRTQIAEAAESELELRLQLDEANDKVFCLKHVIASIDRVVAQAFVAESNRDMEMFNALSGLLRVAKRIA
jgi:hypothetical protein